MMLRQRLCRPLFQPQCRKPLGQFPSLCVASAQEFRAFTCVWHRPYARRWETERYPRPDGALHHRRHAEIENAIRDLKYGVGLNHLPSGRFAANGAWLAVQVMAHNLVRWTARLGLGEQIVTTKTLRRRFFSIAGRLTRSARRLTLHLPKRWPWETQFSGALARSRAIPLPT